MSLEPATPELFWLHVPLETTRGDWLKPPPDGRLTVLGWPARLCSRKQTNMSSLTNAGTGAMLQWLLFDPLPERDAENLLAQLRAKIPVLSLRQDAALRVGASPLRRHDISHYNGPVPTLIPAKFPEPVAAWVDVRIESHLDAKDTLERVLSGCPDVQDERIRAAIDLSIASRYDVLPRSIFLAQLTIVDSLAERADRPATIQKWIDEKIKEAEAMKDDGLVNALNNLRQGSHGGAVRSLVRRATRLRGLDDKKVQEAVKTIGALYGVRSGLSHAGGATTFKPEYGGQARDLARLVLEAAIQDPRVLDA